jgi:very-short-patch-repair endonuclease
LCRAARLVVELDGWSHGLRQEEDLKRDSFMMAQGFAMLRFSNMDVTTNLAGVVQAIAMTLAERCPDR